MVVQVVPGPLGWWSVVVNWWWWIVVVILLVSRNHHHSSWSSQKPYTIVDGSEGVIQKTSPVREACK